MSAAKYRSVILIVIFLLGALLISAKAVTTQSDWEFKKATAGQAMGTITEIYAKNTDISGRNVYNRAIVTVSYSVGSRVYESNLTLLNKVLHTGQKITVYYDKDYPARLYREPDYLNFLYTIGGIMFFIALILMWNIFNIA
jgi:hypothetical protein